MVVDYLTNATWAPTIWTHRIVDRTGLSETLKNKASLVGLKFSICVCVCVCATHISLSFTYPDLCRC